MGMYTELVLKCEIAENIPPNVHGILNYLFNNGEEVNDLPDHEFFRCSRWSFIGRCSSFYHIPFALSRYSAGQENQPLGGYIFSRSDLKNYSGEIEAFIDWLMPYIAEKVGHCIGWSWYEEEEKPTLLFKVQGKDSNER